MSSVTFVDRKSTYPNRYLITPENGSEAFYGTLERADEPTVMGTPLNAETLNRVVSAARTSVTATTTLSASSWAGDAAPYTQTVAVADVLSDDRPHVGAVYSDDLTTALAQKEAWAMVDDIDSGDGTVTFTCFESKPTVDIPIQIEVNR